MNIPCHVLTRNHPASQVTTSIDVGTNGGTAWTRPGTPPAASDTVLRTDTGYAADSVQQVQLSGGPTGGTFTLTFNGQTTAAIAYNASAAAVQSALQALSSVGSGNALVANPTGAAWVVRFAGTLAGAAQPALTGNGAGLTGGTSPSVAVTLTSLGGDAGRVQQTTDPRGLISKMDYDWLGRTVRTVEAFATFNPSNSADNTTEYSYDGSNHIITVQADLAGGAYEQTKYVYGVTTAGGSGLNSNDVLAAMQYPDPGTGNPSSTQQESYTANALGEQIGLTDRDGDVHAYLYDVLGRLTSDQVTTLGSGVDGTVRRLDTAYDTQGNAYLFTSYSTTAGTTVVNQVQRGYNGLGQLTTEYQEHGGAVNTSSSAKVQYTYSEMAGGANHSRLTSVVYPGTGTAAKTVNYNYAAGLDDRLSRLTSLSDSSATLESYSYLGLDTVVDRSHPQPGVDLTFIKQTGEANGDAGDQYTGLDRFGRVVDQRWLKVSTQVATDRFKYGYDRDSNRLYHDNLVNTAFGELYHANGAANGYDSLNQLGAFSRGVLSDTNADGVPDTVASAAHSQSWSYDALGNWTSFTSDASTQTRTANKQNEVTSISGQTTPGYDGNGNTTTDQAGNTLVYDAWNRLVAYKSGSTTLAAYGYDALGRRLSQTETGTTTDVYYSAAWQVLEERVGGTAKAQYVWGPVYVDALVERDRDADGNAGNGLEERLYAQQDANWNVTALLDTGGNVVERYAYDPFGAPTVLTPAWAVRGSSSYAWVYLHQGGRFDGVTGLYHFRSRDYSPALGRWLSQDPVKQLGGVNLYGYLAENPLHFTDAAGLAPLDQQIVGPKEVLGRIPGRIPFPVRGGVVAGMVARMIDQARDAFSENLQGVGLSKETADDIAAEVGGGDAALFYLVREFNPGSRGPGKDAFVYTCKCGWIDIGHFFWSAATTALLGKSAAAASWTLLAGYLIELHQALVKLGLAANHKDINDWAASAFTLEDLPSNSMGAVFALRVTSKTFRGAMGEIRTKLAAMFKACGAVDPANIIGIIGLGRFTARDFLERDARAYQEASFKKGFVPWRGIDPYNFFIFPVKTHSHDCVCDKAGNPINRRK